MTTILLQPDSLWVRELSLDMPEDGGPITATATVDGDARARADEQGITITTDNVTWGPFRGLGDYEWDSDTGTTTLVLAEMPDDRRLTPRFGTVQELLEGTWPGIDTTALPTFMRDILTGEEVTEQQPGSDAPTAREWFNRELGPLGLRLIRTNSGGYLVAGAADGDLLFDGPSEEGGERRDRSNIPRRIIVTGGSEPIGGRPSIQVAPAAISVAGKTVTLTVPNSNDPSIWGYRLRGSDGTMKTFPNMPGGDIVTWLKENAAQGVHTYTFTPMVKMNIGGGVVIVDGEPSTPAVALVEVTELTPRTVRWQTDPTGLSVALPAGAPFVRVIATSSKGSGSFLTSGGVSIGPGRDINLALQPGDTVSVSYQLPETGQAFGTGFSARIPDDSIQDFKTAATARTVIMSWKTTDTSGTQVYEVTVKEGAAVKYQGNTTQREFTVVNLIPGTAYSASVKAFGGTEVETSAFTTEAVDDFELSREEVFEVSSSGVLTSINESKQETKIEGQSVTTTSKTTNTKTKTGGVLTKEVTITEGTTFMVSPGQGPEQQQTRTVSTTEYRYELPAYPSVQTGSRTETVATTPGGETLTVETVKKVWHPRGWVSAILKDTGETIRVMMPQQNGPDALTVGSVKNVRRSERWTRVSPGAWSWSASTETTTSVPVGRLDPQTGQTEPEIQEVMVVETESSASAPPPEMVPQTQGGTGQDLGTLEPYVGGGGGTDPGDGGGPGGGEDPGGEDPGGGPGEPTTTPPTPEEEAFEPADPEPDTEEDVQKVPIIEVRQTQGHAEPMTVSMPSLGYRGVVSAAADYIALNYGRPTITRTRTYSEPVGAQRGGSVRGVRITLHSVGTTYEEEVTTTWPVQV